MLAVQHVREFLHVVKIASSKPPIAVKTLPPPFTLPTLAIPCMMTAWVNKHKLLMHGSARVEFPPPPLVPWGPAPSTLTQTSHSGKRDAVTWTRLCA